MSILKAIFIAYLARELQPITFRILRQSAPSFILYI